MFKNVSVILGTHRILLSFQSIGKKHICPDSTHPPWLIKGTFFWGVVTLFYVWQTHEQGLGKRCADTYGIFVKAYQSTMCST